MTESERDATEFLEAHSFAVREIPEHPQERRADLCAFDRDDFYVVEVKGREYSEQYRQLLARVDENGHADDKQKIRPNNTLSGIIADAHEQLEATPSDSGAFRIMWLSCMTSESGAVIPLFECTLYGAMDVVVLTDTVPHGCAGFKTCYRYTYSDFYRFADVHAAILASPDGLRLCANDVNPEAARFRGSRLYGIFRARGLCDPWELERAGMAFIVDEDIDRSDSKAAGVFLRQKYGVITSTATMSHFATVMRVYEDELPGQSN